MITDHGLHSSHAKGIAALLLRHDEIPAMRRAALPQDFSGVRKPRRGGLEQRLGMQGEVARSNGAALDHVADLRIHELARTGPGEQFLSVDQRNFDPDHVDETALFV